MKNLVVIIKNIPDDMVTKGLVEALKDLEMDIDPSKPIEMDWSTSNEAQRDRIIDVIVKAQSNYAYLKLRAMPPEQRLRVLQKLAKETTETLFKNKFGNFNLN